MREFNNQVNVSIVDSPFIMCICKKIHLATSREAAEIFGDGVNAFSRYENGKTKPPWVLLKLFEVLNAPDLLAEVRVA